MYQFSLDAYTDLFKDSITRSRDAKSVDNLPERIATLNNFHTEAVYKFTCRGLFEKHKLLFSFLITIRKMQADQRVNNEEYDFFLKGAQIMDRSQRPPNPCDWLEESIWDNISELDKLPAFKNLAASFDQLGRDWKKWFKSDTPELQLPGDWSTKLDELQILLVLRCLRPDRVMFAARSFISANLGPVFVDPPEAKLSEVFSSSSPYTPIVFVLSPGVDPTVQLNQLAKVLGQEVLAVSLGQGQTPIALKSLERGLTLGKWVFFANCHLSISWMPDLEKLVQKFCAGKPHDNFRLWLSSDPHPSFPISVRSATLSLFELDAFHVKTLCFTHSVPVLSLFRFCCKFACRSCNAPSN
jgi:dynein heavy chain